MTNDKGSNKKKTEGWMCPKCGNVYGPHVDECANCNGRGWPVYIPIPYYPGSWPKWETYRITWDDSTTNSAWLGEGAKLTYT